jgi:hypothetical protein
MEIRIKKEDWAKYILDMTEFLGVNSIVYKRLIIDDLKKDGYVDKENDDLIFKDVYSLYGFFSKYLNIFSKKVILVILEGFTKLFEKEGMK